MTASMGGERTGRFRTGTHRCETLQTHMDGLPFFIFSLLCGLYLAFMLATGETLQANLKMQRITRTSAPLAFRFYVTIVAVICAGTFLLSLGMLLTSIFFD